jgi:arylsulfatase A-like enzyme
VILAVCLATLIVGCAPEIEQNENLKNENLKNNSNTFKRPNIVLIYTDDLDTDSISRMPNLRSLLVEQGTTFENSFVTNSLCCPSRATMLRGQYTHNHKIFSNAPPHGGAPKFRALGREDSTVATWLKEEGYQTAFFGKYLNHYGGYGGNSDKSHVPKGWDEWHAIAGNYMSNRISDNGKVTNYDPKDRHITDVLSDKASGYVQNINNSEDTNYEDTNRRETTDNTADNSSKPFFIVLGTKAPHQPAIPPQRYKDDFSDVSAPRSPSFNEEDVSDKPEWVRDNPKLSRQQVSRIENLHRNRLRSLLAVDDAIGSLVGELKQSDELDNTYIFFTSDNGFHLGEHRLEVGKWTAYEEDIRVPLIVRGPDVPADKSLGQMILNNDLAPTFMDLAGGEPPAFVDGRSLEPLLNDGPPSETSMSPTSEEWRKGFLVESAPELIGEAESPPTNDDNSPRGSLTGDSVPAGESGRTNLKAIRTEDYLYVEYANGERELYDIRSDPYQLDNMYSTANPALLRSLEARLDALRECSGSSCKAAENDS